MYGSSRLGIINRTQDADQPKHTPETISHLGNAYLINFTRGQKFFELTNHLGNVMVVISDKKLPRATPGSPTLIQRYDPQYLNGRDYSPFGASLPSRGYRDLWLEYRYGFNGKDIDNSMLGPYNAYDYGFRIYDPRVGRFLSVDPLTKSFPWYTPYQYAGNKPIWATDLDGLEERPTTTGNERTTEFATTSTSADLQSSKGPFKEKAIKQWFWHKGSSEHGTNAGWYDKEEYSKAVKPIANDLAGYMGMYGATRSSSNWSDEQKADVVNTSLGRFFSSGISEEGAKALSAEAYSVSMSWNESSSGRTDFSSINVESVIGVVQLIKGVTQSAAKTVAQAESKVFLVTKEGVVLPKGAKIPGEFIENAHRSSNYGIMQNGKFVEKLRIDPATPTGMKGPNFSHYHLDGGSKHLTGNWPWW